MKKPVVLCIMDGFGIRESKEGNAILISEQEFNSLLNSMHKSLNLFNKIE